LQSRCDGVAHAANERILLLEGRDDGWVLHRTGHLNDGGVDGWVLHHICRQTPDVVEGGHDGWVLHRSVQGAAESRTDAACAIPPLVESEAHGAVKAFFTRVERALDGITGEHALHCIDARTLQHDRLPVGVLRNVCADAQTLGEHESLRDRE
jgi:hypothetical protein